MFDEKIYGYDICFVYQLVLICIVIIGIKVVRGKLIWLEADSVDKIYSDMINEYIYVVS